MRRTGEQRQGRRTRSKCVGQENRDRVGEQGANAQDRRTEIGQENKEQMRRTGEQRQGRRTRSKCVGQENRDRVGEQGANAQDRRTKSAKLTNLWISFSLLWCSLLFKANCCWTWVTALRNDTVRAKRIILEKGKVRNFNKTFLKFGVRDEYGEVLQQMSYVKYWWRSSEHEL